jgi:hypothetical protein
MLVVRGGVGAGVVLVLLSPTPPRDRLPSRRLRPAAERRALSVKINDDGVMEAIHSDFVSPRPGGPARHTAIWVEEDRVMTRASPTTRCASGGVQFERSSS